MSGQVPIHGFSRGAVVALLLPPHAALAGIIADSPYARLDEMIRMLIMQILVEQTSGWRGPTRVVRSLLPALSRLLVLGGCGLLFYVRYRSAQVARPDRAIGRSPVKRTGRTSAILSPPHSPDPCQA